MSTLRPDGHPPSTHLPTPNTDAPQHDDGPSQRSASTGATPRRTDVDTTQATPAGLIRAKTHPVLDAPAPQMPSGGQYQAAKSAPLTGAAAKSGTKSSAAVDQKRVALALLGANVSKIDLPTKRLCQTLIGICDKPEGFKSLVASRPGAEWQALVCHDTSQAQAPKGIDHQPLANNMATSYSSADALGLTAGEPGVASKSAKLRTEIFKASMSPKADGTTGVPGLCFAGTRLCKSPEHDNYVLEPSGRFHFQPGAIGDKATAMVAQLHAVLLVGAGVRSDKLVCHPDFPGMQPLVEAIVARMAPAERP